MSIPVRLTYNKTGCLCRPFQGKQQTIYRSNYCRRIETRWYHITLTHVISNKTLPFLTEWNQPESEQFDISLVNSQALTEIKFGSADQERFQTIYQLRPRRRNRTFRLTNAAINLQMSPTVSDVTLIYLMFHFP